MRRKLQIGILIAVLGLVLGGALWWTEFGLDTSPNAYATVSAACDRTSTVSDYDLTIYITEFNNSPPGEPLVTEHRIQISNGVAFSAAYDDGEHLGNMLTDGANTYFQEAGGDWYAGSDGLGPLDDLLSGQGLCPDLTDQVTMVGRGSIAGRDVQHFKPGTKELTDQEREYGHTVYSVDDEGWLHQFEIVPPESIHPVFGKRPKLLHVFDGINEANVIPDIAQVRQEVESQADTSQSDASK